MINDSTYILGLCTMGNSSAALFKDGELIAAVEEERLSRKKNSSFPYLSINEVLYNAGIKLEDVSIISIYWQPWRIISRAKGTLKKVFSFSNSRKSILKKTNDLFNNFSSYDGGSWLDLFFIK